MFANKYVFRSRLWQMHLPIGRDCDVLLWHKWQCAWTLTATPGLTSEYNTPLVNASRGHPEYDPFALFHPDDIPYFDLFSTFEEQHRASEI